MTSCCCHKDNNTTLKDHPGKHFTSLPDVLKNRHECHVIRTTPSTEQRQAYFENIYLSTLLQHLENRYPVITIIEAFSIFDTKSLPEDPVQRQSTHGTQKLDTLWTHYGPYSVIATDSLKAEYLLFVNPVKADDMLAKLSTREVMMALVANTMLQVIFSNLAKIASIGPLLPMSTVDCKWALQRSKTDLRNRLSNRILNYFPLRPLSN